MGKKKKKKVLKKKRQTPKNKNKVKSTSSYRPTPREKSEEGASEKKEASEEEGKALFVMGGLAAKGGFGMKPDLGKFMVDSMGVESSDLLIFFPCRLLSAGAGDDEWVKLAFTIVVGGEGRAYMGTLETEQSLEELKKLSKGKDAPFTIEGRIMKERAHRTGQGERVIPFRGSLKPFNES